MEMRQSKLLLAVASSFLALSVSVAAAGEVVWWTPNWGEARAKELADKFMAANPDITIRMEVTVSDGLPQRVLTALQSGAPPDIMEVQHGWVNGYAQNDLVIPLDDTIQDKEDFNAAALGSVTWDGKVWGIPYRME
ncbi:MAG: extracellular solute-binding protein, partial [Hyphomicrobiales bacterium]